MAKFRNTNPSEVTERNRILNLPAKLDAARHYEDSEVDRVVAIELKPNAKRSELGGGLEPVADRLLKRYKAVRETPYTVKEQAQLQCRDCCSNINISNYL